MMAEKLKLGKKKQKNPSEKVVNYYEIYKLNRNDSYSDIRTALQDKHNIVSQKLNCATDSTEIKKLKEEDQRLKAAVKRFKTAEAKKIYDEELDYALEHNLVDTESQKIAEDIWEEIEKWYIEENYMAIIRKCNELLESSTDLRLYQYLSKSYYFSDKDDMALSTVDKCVEVHPKDISALKLAARAYNDYADNINKAQDFINRMLEIDPESAVVVNEQLYLYLCMNNKNMAFSLADEYLEKNPSDSFFREECAVSIINYSYKLYTLAQIGDSVVSVLADEQSYNACLELAEKAYSICDAEFVKAHLDEVRSYGETEFNTDNAEYIKWMKIGTVMYGIGTIAMLFAIGTLGIQALLYVLMLGGITAGLVYCTKQLIDVSNRPYWQILKYELTGEREKKEKIYILVGKIFTGYIKAIPKITWKVLEFAFRLALPG